MPATSTTALSHQLRLNPETRLERLDGHLLVWHRYGRVAVAERDHALTTVLDLLAAGPVELAQLETVVLSTLDDVAESVSGLARLHWLLGRLGAAVSHGLSTEPGDDELLHVVPLTGDGHFAPVPADPDRTVVLSRLAFIRRRGDEVVLESGAAAYRAHLSSPEALLAVATLARPTTVAAIAESTGLDASVVATLVGFLSAAGLTDADDDRSDLWNFHEILFHARSRLGRHDEPFGATFAFLSDRPPVPPLKAAPAGPAVDLPRPALDDLIHRDPPLVLAQEARRSVRGYGARPVSVDQVAEFLYRVGRVRAIYGPDDAHRMPYEAVDRPYPTGGGAGDLEIYLTAHRVAGLDRAAYYYDAVGHRLVRVCDDPTLVDALLFGAAQSTGGMPTPDVLITFTSRFGRLTWKYDGMAYAATLKHVGVAYQTCYLVATAMRLAGCGLGSGDSHLSARVFGLDWQAESSVGEFMLGSLPEWADGTDPHAGRPHWRPGNDPQWSTQAARILSEREQL